MTIAFVCIISCTTSGSRGKQSINITPIKGYFIKNTVEDAGDIQCFVFTDQSSFSEICGMATTMVQKPDMPDFENDLLVVIAGASTNRPTTIDMIEANLEKGILTIFINEEVGEEELTYTLRPTTMAAVSKTGVKKVVIRKSIQEICSITL